MSPRAVIHNCAMQLAVAQRNFRTAPWYQRRSARDELLLEIGCGVQNCLRALAMQFPASADTHPKDGDAKLAPLVSGAVPHVDEADARNVSRNLSSNNSRKV